MRSAPPGWEDRIDGRPARTTSLDGSAKPSNDVVSRPRGGSPRCRARGSRAGAVSIQCSERIVASARPTDSIDAPVQPASSSWERRSSMRMTPSSSIPKRSASSSRRSATRLERRQRAEARALVVGVAQAPREHPEQRHRGGGMVGEEGAEVRRRDHQRLDRLQRDDRRRARLPVDRGELAEQLARAADREHDLAAGGRRPADLDLPGAQHDHRRRAAGPGASAARPRAYLRIAPAASIAAWSAAGRADQKCSPAAVAATLDPGPASTLARTYLNPGFRTSVLADLARQVVVEDEQDAAVDEATTCAA